MFVLAFLALLLARPGAALTLDLKASALLGGASTSSGEPPEDRANCAVGKLLPEFYVIGAKNTATTSLYTDLMRRGVIAAPGTTETKEWQFFQDATGLPENVQQQLWLASLPSCPKKRVVMADFSTTNLFTVKLPSDFAWSMELGYPARKDMSVEHFRAAKLISQFHARVGGITPGVVVLLREPLARVHSEWYHTLPLKNCNGCMVNGSFVDSFATNVALLQKQPPLMSDWFWKSFYARQIEEYLKYFDAKQFFFVPNREYFAIDPAKFSASLLSWLRIDSEPWREASRANSHEKPPLDEELPPDTPSRSTYEALMAPELDRLVRVLALASSQGAFLAGFGGEAGDEAMVREWLVEGW